MSWFFAILAIVLLVVLASVAALKIAAARAPVPELGVADGRLSPCPETANCVSSQAHIQDDVHYLPPVPFRGDPERVRDLVDEVVMARPRTTRVDRSSRYLRYEFETYLMRFVDDVEVFIDADESLIHFRSASRIGRDDMGTNAIRMRSLTSDIRAALDERGLDAGP